MDNYTAAPPFRKYITGRDNTIVTPDVYTAAKTLRERQTLIRDDGTSLHYTLVNIKDWCKNSNEVINQLRMNTEEELYARRVSMDEIEENGFNLNISRYISTAVAEEEIDLQKVNAELVEIDGKINVAMKRHNAFLKELGLPEVR